MVLKDILNHDKSRAYKFLNSRPLNVYIEEVKKFLKGKSKPNN